MSSRKQRASATGPLYDKGDILVWRIGGQGSISAIDRAKALGGVITALGFGIGHAEPAGSTGADLAYLDVELAHSVSKALVDMLHGTAPDVY